MADVLVNAARLGSLAAVERALQLHGDKLNRLDRSETTALLAAVWRNHLPIVERLLSASAAPDVPDGESGWTSLHRAFYWGHLRLAAKLLEAGARLNVPDFQGRTPLDLLSAELKVFLRDGLPGDVYSWGNGSNYQLGTGAEGLQPEPLRVDSLHASAVVQLAAAKFHSAALTEDGVLYTWGFGRGGRLGHPEFEIHSGETAVIVPRPVSGLGKRQVVVVSVAKHHTAAVTGAGELWTWGSNRDGKLGYAAVDSQPTPRRVATLRQRVVAVAAASKHTAAIADNGSVFSWGNNRDGQLGYGTSDSSSAAGPRLVEALKGKQLVAVSAAKRHTMVLTGDGDVYTWGHRAIIPRRVPLAGARDTARAAQQAPSSGSAAGAADLLFHKGQAEVAKPRAVAIAAGVAHSCCLTHTGVVLAWRSADPGLVVEEVAGALAGKQAVSISAGKHRTAVVTDTGDLYMWEGSAKVSDVTAPKPERGSSGKRPLRGSTLDGAGLAAAAEERGDKPRRSGKGRAFEPIAPARLESLKRITRVAVGEKHSLALQSWCSAPLPLDPVSPAGAAFAPDAETSPREEAEEAAWTAAADDVAGTRLSGAPRPSLGLATYWQDLDGIVSPDRARNSPQPAQRRAAQLDHPVHLDHPIHRLGAPSPAAHAVPSLQRLCERSVAAHLVEPRTALQILEFADAAGAEMLRQHCMAVALSNLDAVLLEARGVLEQLPPHVLADLERLQKAHFVVSAVPSAAAAPEAATALRQQLASSSTIEGAAASGGRATGSAAAAVAGRAARLLTRRPTSAPDATGADEEAAPSGDAHQRTQSAAQAALRAVALSTSSAPRPLKSERSFQDVKEASEAAAVGRQVRHIKKKLQQIHALQQRAAEGGPPLDAQQRAKVAQRGVLETALNMLDGGAAVEEAVAMLAAANSAGGEDPLAESGSKPFELSRAALSAHAPFAGSSSRDADAVSVSGSAHGSTRSRRKTRARRSSSSGSLVTLAGSEGAAEVPGQAAADLSPSTDASSRRAESTTHAGRRSSAPGTTLHAEAGTASAGGGPSSLTPASRGAGGSFVGRTAAEPMSAPRPAAAQEEAGGFVTPGKAIRRGQLSAMFSTPTVLAGTPNMDAFHSQMSPAGATPTPPAKTTSGWALRQADQPRNPSPGLFGSSPPLPRYPSPMTGSSWANMAAGQASAGAAAAGADKAKKAAGKRKGGLSMFLAGEMDKPAAPAKASPAPSKPPPMEAPWGPASSLPSLRDIQDEEARQAVAAAAAIDTRRKAKEASVLSASSDEPAASRIPLAQFVKKSSPIAMAPQERKTASPAWGAVLGSSPTGGVPIACAAGGLPSLRDIQAQQQEKRDAASRSWGASPGSRGAAFPDNMAAWRLQAAAGALGSSPGASFPSGTSPGSAPRRSQSFNPSPAPASKWYIQEEREIVPLVSIQTQEESAQKELAEREALARELAEFDALAKAQSPGPECMTQIGFHTLRSEPDGKAAGQPVADRAAASAHRERRSRGPRANGRSRAAAETEGEPQPGALADSQAAGERPAGESQVRRAEGRGSRSDQRRQRQGPGAAGLQDAKRAAHRDSEGNASGRPEADAGLATERRSRSFSQGDSRARQPSRGHPPGRPSDRSNAERAGARCRSEPSGQPAASGTGRQPAKTRPSMELAAQAAARALAAVPGPVQPVAKPAAQPGSSAGPSSEQGPLRPSSRRDSKSGGQEPRSKQPEGGANAAGASAASAAASTQPAPGAGSSAHGQVRPPPAGLQASEDALGTQPPQAMLPEPSTGPGPMRDARAAVRVHPAPTAGQALHARSGHQSAPEAMPEARAGGGAGPVGTASVEAQREAEAAASSAQAPASGQAQARVW